MAIDLDKWKSQLEERIDVLVQLRDKLGAKGPGARLLEKIGL